MLKIAVTFIFLITLTANAQQIWSIEQLGNSVVNKLPIPDDVTYYKDIHHSLDPFVGTYIGSQNNKNIRFTITKSTGQRNAQQAIDQLMIRYQITDSNGQEIANTLNLPNDAHAVIKGSYMHLGNYYLHFLYGENLNTNLNVECGNSGTMIIKRELNSIGHVILKMIYFTDPQMYLEEDCPNGFSFFPLEKRTWLELLPL